MIFAGFNALTTAEEVIIAAIIKQSHAEMYWDLDAYYFKNTDQEAGFFLRKYARHKVFGPTFPAHIPDLLSTRLQEIEMVGVPLSVGQAKLLGEVLQKSPGLSETEDPEKTAVVLPDEQMLFPVLHSLPAAYTEINVTMGYPLKDTPLYGFLEHLLDLQQNVWESNAGKTCFYFQNVLSILKHPYFSQHSPEIAAGIIKDIELTNRIHVETEDLQTNYFYREVFRKVDKVEEIFDYLLEVLLLINRKMSKGAEEQSFTIEKEYVFHFYTQLKRLKEIVTARRIDFALPTFIKLFRHIIHNLKLPFSGEPLNGLQVMGVLETRNLDFENVYILSMNEGKFPPGVNQSSFIPFNLRKGYNLPTYEHQDAIYAYNFYRLIQRAKKVVLFYNTESGLQTGGEMSRFLYQLQYEAPVKVKQRVLSNPIKVPFPVPIVIPKDEKVMAALQVYTSGSTEGSARSLTPSAFNIYLDCRLKFYFRYVLRLFESDSIQEEIDAAVFGNLLHHTMEAFYRKILAVKGHNLILEEDLQQSAYLEQAVINAFMVHFHLEHEQDIQFEGRNLIVKEIILKMGREIVKNDSIYAPFYIVGLEAEEEAYRVSIPIETMTGSKKVSIKGIIDRVSAKIM